MPNNAGIKDWTHWLTVWYFFCFVPSQKAIKIEEENNQNR